MKSITFIVDANSDKEYVLHTINGLYLPVKKGFLFPKKYFGKNRVTKICDSVELHRHKWMLVRRVYIDPA